MVTCEDNRCTPITTCGTYTGDVLIIGWTVATPITVPTWPFSDYVLRSALYEGPDPQAENDQYDLEEMRAAQRADWIPGKQFSLHLYQSRKIVFKRRLMFSLSGWLAPPGKLKRCGKYEGRN
jgi:hypothetical protein